MPSLSRRLPDRQGAGSAVSRAAAARAVTLLFCTSLLLVPAGAPQAGGGVILRDDTCIITIGFYEAHFTAYQPDTRGDEEFCEDLPDAARTVIVLDYLHPSMREVPVDLRIIRNETGKGEFARQPDVEALGDLEPYSVYYQPPVVRAGGSFQVEHSFDADGEYIGIVTAGHPSNNNVYVSVFPFAVGQSSLPWGWFAFGAVLLLAGALLVSVKRIGGTGENGRPGSSGMLGDERGSGANGDSARPVSSHTVDRAGKPNGEAVS